MSDDREKLKALLLSEEMAEIKALQLLLNDKQALSQKISEILDPATDLVIAKNPSFQKKFSKIDPKSYVRAIQANKQAFIEALLPIIGPMIRKSVSTSIRGFITDINRMIEHGVSAKALKWRWLSFKTGVPFAEIMFNNTVEYQVQQVFLIDNHSGLLIEHAGHEESLLQDKDAMSAMLTAIQDFVKDSLSSDGDGLSAAELGDNLVWLVQGSQVNMAVVIKGAPTQKLHDAIVTSTENIHIEFHLEISDQKVWNNSPELKLEIEKLLVTKSQSDSQEQQNEKRFNFWPWLLITLALLSWWGWSSYKHHQLRQQITNQLNLTPGFVLTDLNYQDGRFIASGWQDPLADLSHLDEQVSIQSTAFVSLDDEIIAKRIQGILNDSKLKVESSNNNLTITGITENNAFWQQKRQLISMLPGVNQINDSTTNPVAKPTLKDFLVLNPLPDNIEIEQLDETIFLSGMATKETLTKLSDLIQEFGEINTSQIEIINSDDLAGYINNNPLVISQPGQLSTSELSQLSAISNAFQKLLRLQANAKIKLKAQSDCQGSIEKSNSNNQARLNSVQSILINQGITSETILAEISLCKSNINESEPNKIGVWFEAVL